MANDVQEASESAEKTSLSDIDPKIRERVLKEEPKAQKELAKWRKEKARPKHSGYLWYLMLILTLVYIVDEVATNLNSTMLYTKFCSPSALAYLDFVYLALAIPGVLGAILVIVFKVSETKGIDLDTVRGDEWDKPALAQK
jgi:uncharacterized membrane protein